MKTGGDRLGNCQTQIHRTLLRRGGNMGHLRIAVSALPRTAFPLCGGRVGGGVLHYERRVRHGRGHCA